MSDKRIAGDSVHEVWTQLLQRLIDHGQPTSPRGQDTKELLGVQLYISDLRANVLTSATRNLNYRFMVTEWLWIALGRNDLAPLGRVNARMAEFSDDGVILAGAYGPPFDAQLHYVRDTLRRDRDTRQAVLTFWRPHPGPSRDIPCTIGAQFLARGGALHSIYTMRSSDVWLGVPYDIFTFTQLTNCLAGVLRLSTGSFLLQMGSSHLYSRDYEAATRVLQANDCGTLRSPALLEFPPLLMNFALSGARRALQGPWERYQDTILCGSRGSALVYLEELAKELG